MVNKVDVIIVGGGLIGLATALKILKARPNIRLILIEKELSIARHQSGNNSGVIHSGLYYRPGSLKAINCRRGYEQMLDFCRQEDISHEVCGKVVIATTESEVPMLKELHARGMANGLSGLRYLQPDEISEIEPHCFGVKGLFVPQTGIVDYLDVAKVFATKLRQMGAEIILGECILDIKQHNNQVEVLGSSGMFSAGVAVICAGLQSDRLARMTAPNLPLKILPFRGEYYKLKKTAPKFVKNLIYPVPNINLPFLGVHFTRMIDGNVECGPNAVFSFGREAYSKTDFNLRDTFEALAWPGFRKVAGKYWRTGLEEFHRSISKKAFVKALQQLIPEIQSEHLEPGGAGIRAQACDLKIA